MKFRHSGLGPAAYASAWAPSHQSASHVAPPIASKRHRTTALRCASRCSPAEVPDTTPFDIPRQSEAAMPLATFRVLAKGDLDAGDRSQTREALLREAAALPRLSESGSVAGRRRRSQECCRARRFLCSA
jgi:hypothetical protein